MVQQSKANAVKVKEQDPLFPEFENYNKTIEEDKKFAEEYVSLRGNKFDKNLDKHLKNRKEKLEESLDLNTDRNQTLSPDLATLWPKKVMTNKNARSPRKRSKKDKHCARD